MSILAINVVRSFGYRGGNMMANKTIDFGINPSRFVGISYNKRMYGLHKLSGDARPLLTIHLLFVVVWIRLPWSHVSEKKHAVRVVSYGGVVRLHPFYFNFNWG